MKLKPTHVISCAACAYFIDFIKIGRTRVNAKRLKGRFSCLPNASCNLSDKFKNLYDVFRVASLFSWEYKILKCKVTCQFNVVGNFQFSKSEKIVRSLAIQNH